jgi:hypothetical protein
MHRAPLLPKRLALAVVACVALAGTAAGTAQADSIAYIKGGDVWLTTTDAARQFQVTGTGEFFSVAQADDGTMVATTQAGHLQRLDRYGRVLSDITTLDADVSPDGKTVGYGFMKMGAYKYPDGSMDADLYDGHGFSRSDAATGFLDAGYKFARDWSAPEFVDNSTVLVSNGPSWPSAPFALEKVGSGDPRSWFDDPDNRHPMDATIARNRRFVAAVHGPDRLSLSVYRIGDGALESAPVNRCFVYSDPAGYRYESPTISADGKVIAWGTGKGLDIAPLGDATSGCPDGQSSREVLPGASQPDWGPADVPASRPADAPLRTKDGGGGSTNNGGSAPNGANTGAKPGVTPVGTAAGGAQATRAGLTVRPTPAKLAAALRTGLTVTVTVPASGRVAIVARSGKSKVGGGTARAAKTGQAVRVKVTFSAAAKAKLRRAKRVALSLTVTAGGASRTVRLTLKGSAQ